MTLELVFDQISRGLESTAYTHLQRYSGALIAALPTSHFMNMRTCARCMDSWACLNLLNGTTHNVFIAAYL